MIKTDREKTTVIILVAIVILGVLILLLGFWALVLIMDILGVTA